jgi:hypothetical protein
MTSLNFQAPAELYLGSAWSTARAQGPRAFATAAKAIRFALEEAAPVSLRGARLQLEGRTYSGEEMRSLYRSQSYPLVRKHPIDGFPALVTKGRVSMNEFYSETMAELYPSRRHAKTHPARHRHLARAAEGRAGSLVEVDQPRFDSGAVRILYGAPEYPMTRQGAAA